MTKSKAESKTPQIIRHKQADKWEISHLKDATSQLEIEYNRLMLFPVLTVGCFLLHMNGLPRTTLSLKDMLGSFTFNKQHDGGVETFLHAFQHHMKDIGEKNEYILWAFGISKKPPKDITQNMDDYHFVSACMNAIHFILCRTGFSRSIDGLMDMLKSIEYTTYQGEKTNYLKDFCDYLKVIAAEDDHMRDIYSVFFKPL